MNNNEKVNVVFSIIDIVEQYMIELEPIVSHKFKQDVKAISSRCKKLIKFVDKKVSEEEAITFGENSDELRELIENHFLKMK